MAKRPFTPPAPSLIGRADPLAQKAFQELADRVQDAHRRLDSLPPPSPPADYAKISQALSAAGSNPLTVQALTGVLSNPQTPKISLINPAPGSGQLAQPGTLALAGGRLSYYAGPLKGWIEITSPASPLNFGAVGDGVTDDSSAVLACVAANKYLYLPPGYTFLTSKITINTLGYIVYGGGGLKAKAALNDDLLLLNGVGNIAGSFFRIENITLDGNTGAQTGGSGACLAFINAGASLVSQSYIHSARGDGIRVENKNAVGYAAQINILDNRIFSNTQHGIYLLPTGASNGQGTDHIISSNHIQGNSGHGIYGLYLLNCIISQNNILLSSLNGIYLTATAAVSVLGNQSRSNSGSGLTIDQDGVLSLGRSNDIQVEGNQFSTNGSDECDLLHCDRVRVVGNTLGFSSPSAAYSLQLLGTTSIYLIGNMLFLGTSGVLQNNSLPYLTQGNLGIYSGPFQLLQSSIASLGLTAYDIGFPIHVTDYNHLLVWTGAALTWGPGEPGSGQLQLFEADPTGNGWHLYDGTAGVPFLKKDGTLGTVNLPNLSGPGNTPSYLKTDISASNIINPTPPNITGLTVSNESVTHTHSLALAVTGVDNTGHNHSVSTTIVQSGTGAIVAFAGPTSGESNTHTHNLAGNTATESATHTHTIGGTLGLDGEPFHINRRAWFRM